MSGSLENMRVWYFCSGHATLYCLRIASKASSPLEATDDGLLLGFSLNCCETSPPSDGPVCNLKRANARRGSTKVAGYIQEGLDVLDGVSTTALAGFGDFGGADMMDDDGW